MKAIDEIDKEIRKITVEVSDPFGDSSESIWEIISFLRENSEGKKSEGKILFDLRKREWEKNMYVTLYLLKIIDVDSFTSRVIYRIRDIMEDSLYSMEGESLSIEADSIGIPMEFDTKSHLYFTRLQNFTRSCSRISGSQFRLVYQVFDQKGIISSKNKVQKIIREFLVQEMREIVEDIDGEVARRYFESYMHDLSDIRAAAEKMVTSMDLGSVDVDSFPPCMKHFISDAKNGVNIPHLGRFAMVSFLNKIGMKEDEIMNIFSSVPDFSKKVTEYQVKHIIGEISGIKYVPPKCETLRSNHLCYMDDDPICNSPNMKHPLTYYKIKKTRKNK